MKTQKGFAVLAVLGIVLGVLIVSGGAYYLGTKKSDQGLNINDTQNKPILQNKSNGLITDSNCTNSTNPYFKIISPNGGESYNVGDTLNLVWKSCNIPENTPITGELVDVVNSGVGSNSKSLFCEGGNIKSSSCLNNGNRSISLANIAAGTYKIKISSNLGQTKTSDLSDNSFVVCDGDNFGVACSSSKYLVPPPTMKAYDLVNKNWGGCKPPYSPEDVCSNLRVDLSKVSENKYKVVAVYESMYDDSIQNEKKEGVLIRENEKSDWVLGEVMEKTWSCKRGHSDYSNIPCL